jgi:hypothetical protein
MYCINWVVQGDGRPALFLHRIRLADGQETSEPAGGLRLQAALFDKDGKPVVDDQGQPVTLRADQKQRAALLLTPVSAQKKMLFAAISGGEVPGAPHGWVLVPIPSRKRPHG